MKKVLLILLLVAPLGAAAQIVITADVPQYNFQVLAGSQRQISVHMTGGKTNLINWSVLSTTGGASATLDRMSNAPGTTGVTIGPTPGACSITGSVGHYVVSSKATVTVQAQSVDDPTKTAKFLFNVCANTTKVEVLPAYQQAYRGQSRSLQSYVVGNADESGTWSIVSPQGGANATLSDTDKRDTIFTGTATGRYTLKYTSKADPSKSNMAIVYVSPNPMPNYTATKNLTQPTECYVDPGLTGKDYEVGPGQKYPTIRSVPTNTWAPGSIMRIHNLDATGANPTTYHESTRIMAGGTPTQPVIMCGVPDSVGNLPVLDGQNAASGAWNTVSTQPYGIVEIWGEGAYNETYASGGLGPDYVVLSGLATQHAGLGYNYIPSSGGSALAQWDIDGACINVLSGQHLLIEGNDMNLCSNGLFVGNNSAGGYGYSSVTEFLYIRGNRMRNSGFATYFKSHDAYVQSFWGVVEGNRFDSTAVGSNGDALKWRGTEGIFRYNFFNAAFGGEQLINEESATDAMPYITFEVMLGAPGDTSCGNPYCQYEKTFSADLLTAYQEALEKDSVYGNIFLGRGVSLSTIQHGDSGGADTYQWTNQTEMSDHLGRMRFYYNTVDAPDFALFQTAGTAGQSIDTQYFKPNEWLANNIIYKPAQTPVTEFAFHNGASFIADFQTNLVGRGTVDLTTPITGQTYTQVDSYYGFLNYTDASQFVGNEPISGHLFNATAANIISSACQPYNLATYAPIAGCGAIGAATPIVDPQAALLPVRSQYSVEQAAIIPRTSMTTVGAVDTGSQPTLTAMAFTPAMVQQLQSFAGKGYGVFPVVLDCTYSDGLHTACGPYATMAYSDGSNSFRTIGGNKIVGQGNGPTSGTMTAAIGSIKATASYANNAAGTVTYIAVDPYAPTINVRGKIGIVATATYQDNSTANVSNTATWTTNNPTVATVAGGVVTGVGVGTAIITVSLQSQFQIVTVSVNPASTTITSIGITPRSASIAAGTSLAIAAIATNSDGTTSDITTSPLTTWTTSNPSVATVASGELAGLSSGTSVITAASGALSGTATISVLGSGSLPPVPPPTPIPTPTPSITSIAVSPSTVSTVIGARIQLAATAKMSDGTTEDVTNSATWTSSNPSIATVAGPVVTPLKTGSVEISASHSNVTSSMAIVSISGGGGPIMYGGNFVLGGNVH